MNRRGFLRGLVGTAATAALAPEELDKFLWSKKKTIFIPTHTFGPSVLTLKPIVAQINYSIFDVEMRHPAGFQYLEAKDLTDCVDAILKRHDEDLWIQPDHMVVSPAVLPILEDALRPPSQAEAWIHKMVANTFDIPLKMSGFEE